MPKMLLRAAMIALLLSFLPKVSNPLAADRMVGRADATRSVVWGKHGMVASAIPLASQVGVEILRSGGSAVDAAIAMNAMLALTEPTACGLGGDLFAIVWDPKSRKLHGLNASGRSPRAMSREDIAPTANGTIPLYSPYAWSVPGCADGWFELHARFGRLPMETVLARAIETAREGFPVTQLIAHYWGKTLKGTPSRPAFAEMPGFADTFLPQGHAPKEGELFANPALANTLELMAKGGRDAFYDGPIAERIVSFSQDHGGYFSRDDFRRHESTWDDPVGTNYRGYDLWELPPNGQGIAALQMLNILETFDLRSIGRDSPQFWHLMVEAKKLAYEDRARYYADPTMADVPIAHLIDKAYGRARAKLIDPQRAARSLPAGDFRTSALDEAETTYLCAADADGMMVSLIQSNYTGFGSGYAIPELGFGLQNRGALFALEDDHPNRYEPGKRPFHTIIPAFLTKDGQPIMAFGLMGGGMQPQGHAQIVINLVDFDMGLQEAGDAPRFHHGGSSQPTGTTMSNGGTLNLETTIPWEVRRGLANLGHRVTDAPGIFGGYQAIWRDPVTGVYSGATESRKDGCALGY